MSEKHCNDDYAPEDAGYFLEVQFLKHEIKELVRYEVKPGDGDLLSKARRVLEIGAKHIAEGRPSDEFLQFVAFSIIKTLNGDEPTLDRAFRLEGRNQRPNKDPYSDPAINAYLDAMQKCELNAVDSDQTPIQYERALRDAQGKAIDAAYTVRWGTTPQNDKARGIDTESIKKRRASIRKTVKDLGHY
jgi:hypothetical protein